MIPIPYEDLLRRVLDEGTPKSDRTGTGTRSLFSSTDRPDLLFYWREGSNSGRLFFVEMRVELPEKVRSRSLSGVWPPPSRPGPDGAE